jgi:hypothetical protein
LKILKDQRGMINTNENNNTEILSPYNLTGTVSIQINNLYDDYELDDFAVDRDINI